MWPGISERRPGPPTPKGVARDLGDSAHDFLQVVWPAVRHLCGGGDLLPTETEPGEMSRQLDRQAGIDAWQVLDGVGMRGISSRVQWPGAPLPSSWRTFTIRKSRRSGAETEYEKRLRAVSNRGAGWLSPHLHIQAYLDRPAGKGSPLLAAAVARMEDIIAMIRDGREGEQYSVDVCANATFYVIDWQAMVRDGLRVEVIPEAVSVDVWDTARFYAKHRFTECWLARQELSPEGSER